MLNNPTACSSLHHYPPVGQFTPARQAEAVWQQSTVVIRAALEFAATWRECYDGCTCIRCNLAHQADRLEQLVKRGAQ